VESQSEEPLFSQNDATKNKVAMTLGQKNSKQIAFYSGDPFHSITRLQDALSLATVPAFGGSTPPSWRPILAHQGGEAAGLADQNDFSQASEPGANLWHF